MVQNCTSLKELWNIVHELNKKHFPENNLMPILGNGKISHPKIMFIFINPTKANISSSKDWKGERFPFIGTKQIWRIFHKAGLVNNKLIEDINKNSNWSLEFTNEVLRFLKDNGFYFTNIVKWTGHDASLPDSEKIKLFLPILKKEIKLVQPQYIVTFGIIPFENITNKKIKLKDYYSKIINAKKLIFYEIQSGDFKTKIIPCYFPIGRGNPKKAIEILKLVNNL